MRQCFGMTPDGRARNRGLLPPVDIVERCPTASEYVELRRRVGWLSPPIERCARGLEGSLVSVCAMEDGRRVAMGRLIGDGGTYCFVVDVVVDPAAQGRGIGPAVMERLESRAGEQGVSMRLDLIAAKDAVAFCEELGFARQDNALMRKPL